MTLEKKLELEDKTFHIDSSNRKISAIEIDCKTPIKIKTNDEGDVIEFLEGVPGEQVFITYESFIRELCKAKKCNQGEAESKYLLTVDEFIKMMDDINNKGNYDLFYNRKIKNHLAGYRIPGYNTITNIGKFSYIWLVDGNDGSFSKDGWSWYNYGKFFGFSGHLLKN